jgi:hypothetical protein
MTDEQQLMYASDEDVSFYLKCVEGLPTLAGLDGSGKGSDGIPLPYGLGPHSVRCLREISEIVKPKHIFAIGTNMGWSDSLWLELNPECTLISCDISTKKETIVAAEFLRKKYGMRYFYKNRNDSDFGLAPSLFDLIFIDGGHLLNDVIADTKLALELKMPYIAYDDFLPQFGQVQDAIATFGDKLEQVNVNGNIALYKNKTI